MKYMVQIAELEEKDGNISTINTFDSGYFDTKYQAIEAAKVTVTSILHCSFLQFFCNTFDTEHSVGVVIITYNDDYELMEVEDYEIIPSEKWNAEHNRIKGIV